MSTKVSSLWAHLRPFQYNAVTSSPLHASSVYHRYTSQTLLRYSLEMKSVWHMGMHHLLLLPSSNFLYIYYAWERSSVAELRGVDAQFSYIKTFFPHLVNPAMFIFMVYDMNATTVKFLPLFLPALGVLCILPCVQWFHIFTINCETCLSNTRYQ